MKTLIILASLFITLASRGATETKPAEKLEDAASVTSEKTTDKPQPIQVEVLDLEGKRFILVKIISSAEAWSAFEADTQFIAAQQKDAAFTKQLADLALTTPEKEVRGNELQAKLAKLQESNAAMAKTYNFDLSRQYLVVPTQVRVLTALSKEEYTKLSTAKDFKPETIFNGPEDKKFLVRDTINGAGEVETFKVQVGRILQTKRALQGLIEAQPRYTKEEDKKKVDEAIRNTQTEVNNSLEEFKKTRGFEVPTEFNIQTTEAKLYTLLTDEEKKSLEEKAEGKTPLSEKK